MLTYALFPQVGLKFLTNRDNPDAFEPAPVADADREVAPAKTESASAGTGGAGVYTVEVSGETYVVRVSEGGDIESTTPVAAPAPASAGGVGITAPLAGNVFKINVVPGDRVESGDVVIVIEAMKMETEIRAASSGTVAKVLVREGDAIDAGASLVTLN